MAIGVEESLRILPTSIVVARFVLENGARLETELLDKIKAESDIEVNEADKDAFIAASAPIYEEFGTQVEGGKEMIDKAISLGQGS